MIFCVAVSTVNAHQITFRRINDFVPYPLPQERWSCFGSPLCRLRLLHGKQFDETLAIVPIVVRIKNNGWRATTRVW